MNGTITQQGSFTSTGESKTIEFRSDVDWMEVRNDSVAQASQTTLKGVEYFWQRELETGWGYGKSNSANADNLTFRLSSGSFTLVNSSIDVLGPLNNTITAVNTASPPVVTNSGDNLLSAGDVVRLINISNAFQISGMDWTVGRETLTSTTFSLDNAPNIAVATTGSWRKINFQPMFYPRKRTITAIQKAIEPIIVMSVDHGFTVGQVIRLIVPSIFGMEEANGLQATILSLDTLGAMIIDLDTSSFAPFVYPLNSDGAFTRAEVIPIGEAARTPYENLLDGATRNTAFIGMVLGGGLLGPAGQNGDKIVWRAGKSFSTDN